MELFSTTRLVNTVTAEPCTAMPRAAVVTLLFWINRLFAVAPLAATDVVDAMANGALPAVVDRRLRRDSVGRVLRTCSVSSLLMFLPVALPTKFKFLMTSLSAWLLPVATRAMRTTEPNVVVLVAVFWIVRSLFVPPVFGLSPSIVTLLAPLI